MKCVDEIADRKLAPTCKDPLERREIVYKRIMGVDPDLKGVTVSQTVIDRITLLNYPFLL